MWPLGGACSLTVIWKALCTLFFITALCTTFYNAISGSSGEEHLWTNTSHGHQHCGAAHEPRAAAEQRHYMALDGSQYLILPD